MRPTERTLKWLRKMGYTCEVVEKRLPRSFITKDLFGVLDIVAIKPGELGVLGLQVTSSAHVADRVKKVTDEPRATLWCACGNWIWVVGWGLKGSAGRRKMWTPTVVKLHERLADGSATIAP